MQILVVENDPDLAANLGDFLELRRHVVDFADSGPGARTLAAQHRFDVIVLDRMLPGADGASVCRELRERGDATPILMLTALDAVDQRVEGLAAGADDYVIKPFAMDELVARLEALHRRASRRLTPAVLRLGDLEYDPATLTASRGGQRLELSATLRAARARSGTPDRPHAGRTPRLGRFAGARSTARHAGDAAGRGLRLINGGVMDLAASSASDFAGIAASLRYELCRARERPNDREEKQ